MELDIPCLEKKAKELRKKTLDLALKEREAHLGGSFSEIEILISMYDYVLKPEDKFILDKGHACLPWYIILREKGYNPKIQTHPDLDEKNGIYATTGSLAHGLPIGIGMAMARKHLGKSGKIYILLSDGACDEGTVWECALIAPHHNLDNVHIIIDRNYIQALEFTEKVLALGNLEEKFKVFGWDAKTINGHSFKELIPALSRESYKKPLISIANTIKGKGVSYMENNPQWHGRKVNPERLAGAYKELE